MNLDKTVTSLLAGVGILGLAVGFAFQDILSNFVSGVILAVRRPFEVGETIRSNDVFGDVAELRMYGTRVDTFDGQQVWIPNDDVLQGVLINYSRSGARGMPGSR